MNVLISGRSSDHFGWPHSLSDRPKINQVLGCKSYEYSAKFIETSWSLSFINSYREINQILSESQYELMSQISSTDHRSVREHGEWGDDFFSPKFDLSARSLQANILHSVIANLLAELCNFLSRVTSLGHRPVSVDLENSRRPLQEMVRSLGTVVWSSIIAISFSITCNTWELSDQE